MSTTTALRSPSRITKKIATHQLADRSKPLSLRKNFSWTAFSSVFYNFCQFCLLVALTKLGTTEMAGLYTIGLAVTAPVMIFFGTNLRAVIVSDVRRECPFGVYLTFRLISLFLAMSAIFAITMAVGYQFETMLIIMMVGVAKSVEAISAIFFGYFQQNERMDQIAISRIAKGVLSIVFFIDGFWTSGSVLGGVVGLATAWMLTLLFFDIPRAVILAHHRVIFQNAPMERFWPVWSTHHMKKIFKLSTQVGVVVMLTSLHVNIPRYFVEAFEGSSALGIFGPMSYFMVLGNEVVLALGQSAAPIMARLYVNGDRTAAIRLLLQQKAVAALVGISGVVLAAAAGPWILTVAFGPEYAQHSQMLLILMITSGITLMASFSSMFLTATRSFWIQIPVRICSTSAMAFFCYLLVPTHGIIGAATAMLFGTLVHAGLALSATIFILHRMPEAPSVADFPRTLAGQNANN